MASSARPLPAATVVLLRPPPPAAQGPARVRELFMVRRSSQSPFMPDALVFPGGRVDPGDGPEGSDLSFERAARRECLEEVGVRLEGHSLHWFDTWITPSAEGRRRYHARFFLAELEIGEAQAAEADGHETHEGRWGTPGELLDAWRAREVDLPPPTLSVLLTLERDELGGVFDRGPEEARAPILPKVHAQESALQIVMPHDPEYPSISGEGALAPARVADLPRRFVREERVWRPR